MSEASLQAVAAAHYAADKRGIAARTDRMFAVLMLVQWAFAIGLSLYISPTTANGSVETTHPHVYLAVLLGAVLCSLPVGMAVWMPGETSTRQVIAAAQMLWSALLIHVSGGRVEMHFHVFGSLAFLACYRDWRVLATATAVVTGDHVLRGLLDPQSIFGSRLASALRVMEHVSWVLFEDAFLVFASTQSTREMREIALRRAEAEASSRVLEERVHERTRQLAEAQRLARLGSWELHASTGHVSWSDELYELFGLDHANFPATLEATLDRIHPDDRTAVERALNTTMQTGVALAMDLRIVRPTGEIRVLETRGSRVESDGTVHALGTCRDVTEERQLEKRVAISSRMASLGTLAAGVAHEINNPLAIVLGNLDFISSGLPDLQTPLGRLFDVQTFEDMRAAIDEARGGALRVRNIVRDLKAVTRSDDSSVDETDVRPITEASINMATNEIRLRARLIKDLGEVPLIRANNARFGQVVLNLLLNAAQSIPPGNVDSNTVRVTTRTSDAGEMVLEIADTGAGIPLEIRDRIFDPFFTTRAIGSGIGLGLSICHGVIRDLGGDITFVTEVGKGTTFRISVPASKQRPPAPAEPAHRIEG